MKGMHSTGSISNGVELNESGTPTQRGGLISENHKGIDMTIFSK